MTWTLLNHRRGNEREFDSRSEAEEKKNDMVALGVNPEDLELVAPDSASDGGEVVEAEPVETDAPEPTESSQEPAKSELGAMAPENRNLSDDPLDVLPGYMITHVDGKPSLNKRGVSVLAYHYDIDVLERNVVAYPHEHDYETAVVEIMATGPDGRTFSGIGEAHVDETPKHQLLRMAETRAYKRAVIFATGTGIVAFQELMEELRE